MSVKTKRLMEAAFKPGSGWLRRVYPRWLLFIDRPHSVEAITVRLRAFVCVAKGSKITPVPLNGSRYWFAVVWFLISKGMLAIVAPSV